MSKLPECFTIGNKIVPKLEKSKGEGFYHSFDFNIKLYSGCSFLTYEPVNVVLAAVLVLPPPLLVLPDSKALLAGTEATAVVSELKRVPVDPLVAARAPLLPSNPLLVLDLLEGVRQKLRLGTRNPFCRRR